MATRTGAEALVETLDAHGVDHVFGVCGDTSVGLYRALSELDHGVDHVLARDERAASFMADAYARLSGRAGVCEGPSGGGATYLLPGLAEANDSAVPVVGLNTNVPTRYRGRGVLTELPQGELFDPVTKWNAVADHPDLVPRLLRRAFRSATAGRPGATHLSLPMDALSGDTGERASAPENPTAYPAHRPPPEPDAVDRAAAVLADSERPAAVVGGGVHASRAHGAVRELATRAGLPVAETLTAAGALGDSPYALGVVGENGGRPYAGEIVADADALFLFGTAVESVWTHKWSRPADGDARIVRVDVDAESIGRNYATEVAIPADLRATVRALADRLDDPDPKWDADELAARRDDWLAGYEPAMAADDVPLRPERIVADTAAVLETDAVLVSDPGTTCPYFASLYPFAEPGRHWVTPRAHGALGYAIPGVAGAHHARPGAQVVGFTGDGSFGTSAGDLETLARRDLPVTVVVIRNDAFSWIEAGQRNHAEFSFGVDFGGVDYAAVAEEFGLSGYRVEAADGYAAALRGAVADDGPSLIDVPCRPLPGLDDAPVDWLEPDE